jgi:hypothetical protein
MAVGFGASRFGTVSLAALLMSVTLQSLSAQTAGKAASSGGGLRLQGGPENSASHVIRDSLNRPCLDVEAASLAQKVNPIMIDHIISVKNKCPRLIKVKVCYFDSDRCKSFNVGSFGREDVMLGSMTNQYSFRYSLFQN